MPQATLHVPTAVLLSAGDSRRMGRPKALLRVGSETFMEHLCHVFRAAGVTTVAVVVGGRHREPVTEHARSLGLSVWTNPDPTPGPISSVRVALGATRTPLLIQPVDIPGVAVEDVAALLLGAQAAPEADAVIPSVDGRRGHPILLRRTLDVRIHDASLTSLRELWRQSGVVLKHVVRTNRGLLRDVDTPEDYEEWEDGA